MNSRKSLLLVIVVSAAIALLAVAAAFFSFGSFQTSNLEPNRLKSAKNINSNVNTGTKNGSTDAPDIITTTPATSTPLYFTTMTHMEGDFHDDKIEALFDRHVEGLRFAMDLFDEYGAKLTIESEQTFAKANNIWGTNILQQAVERGHGVGTHADFGAERVPLTLQQLTDNLTANKTLVDSLVGGENNRGISGGTGTTDWVLAASAAGFDFMDALTGFGYLSMDRSKRPGGWSDAYIRSTGYHEPIPLDFADRIYSLALKDAADLISDASPVLVVMGGDIGELDSLGEDRGCFPECVLASDDVQKVIEAIDEAQSLRDRSRFARINMHIPMSLLNEENETVLKELLEAISVYVDRGDVLWATQLGAFEAYEDSAQL